MEKKTTKPETSSSFLPSFEQILLDIIEFDLKNWQDVSCFFFIKKKTLFQFFSKIQLESLSIALENKKKGKKITFFFKNRDAYIKKILDEKLLKCNELLVFFKELSSSCINLLQKDPLVQKALETNRIKGRRALLNRIEDSQREKNFNSPEILKLLLKTLFFDKNDMERNSSKLDISKTEQNETKLICGEICSSISNEEEKFEQNSSKKPESDPKSEPESEIESWKNDDFGFDKD